MLNHLWNLVGLLAVVLLMLALGLALVLLR